MNVPCAFSEQLSIIAMKGFECQRTIRLSKNLIAPGKQPPGGGYPASARPFSQSWVVFDCDSSLRRQEAAASTIKGSLRYKALDSKTNYLIIRSSREPLGS